MCLALAVLENGSMLKPLFTNTLISVSQFIHLYSITIALPSFHLSKTISVLART